MELIKYWRKFQSHELLSSDSTQNFLCQALSKGSAVRYIIKEDEFQLVCIIYSYIPVLIICSFPTDVDTNGAVRFIL